MVCGRPWNRDAPFLTDGSVLNCVKGTTTYLSLKSLKRQLPDLTLDPFLQVLRTKLLPTLTYGTEALIGKDASVLDVIIANSYRAIFHLPKYVSSAQIRLEFGIQRQAAERRSSYVKCWHKIRNAEEGSLNSHLWKALHNQEKCPARDYLFESIESLGLSELWAAPTDHLSFKKSVRKKTSMLSVLEDKAILTKKGIRLDSAQRLCKVKTPSLLECRN